MVDTPIEKNIVLKLFKDKDYFNIVFPYLKPELFVNEVLSTIFKYLRNFVEEYDKAPSEEELRLYIDNSQDSIRNSEEILAELEAFKTIDIDALDNDIFIKETEKWVKDRSLELAVIESADILGKKGNPAKIEDKIQKALGISFNSDLGHDYFKNALDRLEEYKKKTKIILSGIPSLDEALGGGFAQDGMYVFTGRTNIGKTLWLCSIASNIFLQGYNVVYFTAEMSASRIAKRIDANTLNVDIDELENLEKTNFLQKLKKIYSSNSGKLIIKEFPTGAANVKHIRSFLQELRLKRQIRPHVIILDYLTIFASYRIKHKADSYNYYKSVAEEMRSLLTLENACVITATQVNRTGAAVTNAKNIDDTVTSDSYGIPFTADWQGFIIQSEQLKELGKYLLKVNKTRFSDNNHEVYTLGVDTSKMRIFETEDKEVPLSTSEEREGGSYG